MSDLHIPATARLLSGWVGPVVLPDGSPAALLHAGALPGTWLTSALSSSVATEELRLDLAQDAAADRVARVLAEQHGGCAPAWDWLGDGSREWALMAATSHRWYGPEVDDADRFYTCVPALDAVLALDPADPRRDRLALAAVARALLVERAP